jgi:hypothetical protein
VNIDLDKEETFMMLVFPMSGGGTSRGFHPDGGMIPCAYEAIGQNLQDLFSQPPGTFEEVD